jgi:hypothetical protein
MQLGEQPTCEEWKQAYTIQVDKQLNKLHEVKDRNNYRVEMMSYLGVPKKTHL